MRMNTFLTASRKQTRGPLVCFMKTKTPPTTNLMSRSLLRRSVLLIPLAFVCFAVLPRALGVLPAPDGGYAGANTAEGDGALQSLTSGVSNTAIGFDALFSDTGGNNNTATGIGTLASNTTGGNNTANGFGALIHNTTGANNTALGFGALL